MTDRLLSNVNIPRLREVFKDFEQISIEDDFCIINMKFNQAKRSINFPFRFDGTLLVWCIKGSLSISVNLNDYVLNENSLFVCIPGNIFRINEIIGDHDELQYVCVAMSREFTANQKVDVNKVFSNALTLVDNPSVTILKEEAEMMASHMNMISTMAASELPFKKDCVQSLWTSILYIFAGMLDRRELETDADSATNRSRILFEQFINLVSRYHTQHRNVGFYADKLYLTPKYLSKLIKSASGKSAPEWIDAYVILEAKNMLKYSNESIKEIVYKLNFPNQSVFYKFFKARTGMTPKEYRNA